MPVETKLLRSAQIRLINSAYAELGRLELQDGFQDVRDCMFYMNLESERGHRKHAPDGVHHGITCALAARLFTVKYLLDGWNMPDRWNVADILMIRIEILYSQAYAKKHHKELADWAAKFTDEFEQVDYAELMGA